MGCLVRGVVQESVGLELWAQDLECAEWQATGQWEPSAESRMLGWNMRIVF